MNNSRFNQDLGWLVWLPPWPAALPQILGCDSNARTGFGSELWQFSVHLNKGVSLPMTSIGREGKGAGAVTCSSGPFLLRTVGREGENAFAKHMV